jgi:UDP-N-acetylglucosamine 2-epimerase (non-hydrolysing)
MTICVTVGTRGEVIGMAPIVHEIKRRNLPLLFIHTGQHYDSKLRYELIRDLELPNPHYSLKCKIGTYGEQVASILENVNKILAKAKPKIVLVQGNNNSTVASTMACVGTGIPVGHVESGVRHGYRLGDNNRRIVERCADYRFAPFEEAVENLKSDGIEEGIHLFGDTYLDAFKSFSNKIHNSASVEKLGLIGRNYAAVTIHTGSNRAVQVLRRLLEIFNSIDDLSFVWTLHPSIEKTVQNILLRTKIVEQKVIFTPPLPYSDFQRILGSSKLVITDSGVTQMEAYLNSKPCITLVNEEIRLSPYPMLVKDGWIKTISNLSELPDAISSSLNADRGRHNISTFGDGHSSRKIVDLIADF